MIKKLSTVTKVRITIAGVIAVVIVGIASVYAVNYYSATEIVTNDLDINKLVSCYGMLSYNEWRDLRNSNFATQEIKDELLNNNYDYYSNTAVATIRTIDNSVDGGIVLEIQQLNETVDNRFYVVCEYKDGVITCIKKY